MPPGGQVAAAGGDGGQAAAQGRGEQAEEGMFGGSTMRFVMQMVLVSLAMNVFSQWQKPQRPLGGPADGAPGAAAAATGLGGSPGRPRGPVDLRNMYGAAEECDLWVHYSLHTKAPSMAALTNESLAEEQGYRLLWRTRVWYEANASLASVNVTVGPLATEVLTGQSAAYLHAALLRTRLATESGDEPPPEEASPGTAPGRAAEEAITQTLPLVVKLRELSADAGAESLFGAEGEVGMPALKRNFSRAAKVPYFKTKLEIRPVFDQTVHTPQSLEQGPFKKLKLHPELGLYEPFVYISDFWLLEKDYLPLNSTLEGRGLNLSLTYSVASLWAWSIQAQMAEQWMSQGEWGLTDTQRDSFMLKRLFLDTNPYLLAFSAAFLMLHTVFSMLAFKNDIQFWRKNQSMQGLSARSMCVSFVCQLITALYLLDSQETSRLILFEILLDLSLATWKLRKAIKFQLKPSFPFVELAGQKGYEDAGTSKYDEEALRYMGALLTPFFLGYVIRSAIYGKHRGWYSFLVGAAAGGMYTFGFVMMTPQLYINYKLQSVEHLPWRALTYKAMNTFVDDVAALLIDMPLMHRLSCFRDDIVFFVYIFQRWKYSVDKTRPSIWVGEEEQRLQDAAAIAAAGAAAELDNGDAAGEAAGAEATPQADAAGESASVDARTGEGGPEAAPESAGEGVRQRRPA